MNDKLSPDSLILVGKVAVFSCSRFCVTRNSLERFWTSSDIIGLLRKSWHSQDKKIYKWHPVNLKKLPGIVLKIIIIIIITTIIVIIIIIIIIIIIMKSQIT